MITTCGIFIIDKTGKILICCPLGVKIDDGWTIPKGKQEDKESPIDAAIRECQEEANIDLKNYKNKFIDLGTINYKHKKKKLHAFVVYINEKIDISSLSCIIHDGEKKPEIIEYEMVSIEDAITRLHEAQGKILEKFLKKKECYEKNI